MNKNSSQNLCVNRDITQRQDDVHSTFSKERERKREGGASEIYQQKMTLKEMMKEFPQRQENPTFDRAKVQLG